MKRVSFKIAKVIKDSGYPQDNIPITEVGWYNIAGIYTKQLPTYWEGDNAFAAIAPTYLDVWLWLWREKKIAIGCPYENTYNYWFTNINAENDKSLILWKYSSGERKDPEEAIEKAIEYLADNDLIK